MKSVRTMHPRRRPPARRVRLLTGLFGAVAAALAMATPVARAAEPAAPPAELSPAETSLAAELESSLADCVRRNGSQREPLLSGIAAGERAAVTFAVMKQKPDWSYPGMVLDDGHQAIVLVEVLVDALGNARFAHVVSRVASGEPEAFERGAVMNFRKMPYLPATLDGQPVASWRFQKVKYIIRGEGTMGNIMSEPAIHKAQKKAREGDVLNAEVVSFLNSVATDEVMLDEASYSRYLARSVLAGERTAILRAARQLGTPGCQNPPRIQQLLRRQAFSGFSDAELLLAGQLMAANDPANDADVATLLHGAANAKDNFTHLWATGLLATHPKESLRDAPFALERALELKNAGDPDADEALAAAQAANGHYAEAVLAETRAINVARALKWQTDRMAERLAAYQQGKPFVGYLCDCRALTP